MNIYLIIIISILVLNLLLEWVVESLNIKNAAPEVPSEFSDSYDAEKYAESQRYLKDQTRFGLFSSSIDLPVTLVFILWGWFAYFDEWARAFDFGVIGTGLLFAGSLGFVSSLWQLPFSWYSTFVLEERYGFNKTTTKIFVADWLKGLGLGAILGGALFAMVIWFFVRFEEAAWLYAWAAVVVFQLLIMYIAPAWILPLFNKFTPLEDGELKNAIEAYAEKEKFKLKGIFKIDGSKRSTKSNAYFTGMGKWKRIALFDTLIENHSVPELVGVLAHEVGHYKKRHIHKMLAASIITTGLMFYILNIFVFRTGLYEAFLVSTESIRGDFPVYAGLIFFGFLYAPISMLLGILQSWTSRKHEFEADAFAAETTGEPEVMVTALKKLAVDNLSNLTPHPLKVFLEYSHPPLLQRIEALRK